ncbi:hypothetical protein SEVIR_9G315050v4 [Setaria viridis]
MASDPLVGATDLSRRHPIHELRRLEGLARLPCIYSLIVNEFPTSLKPRLHPFIPLISRYCTSCFELGLVGVVQLESDNEKIRSQCQPPDHAEPESSEYHVLVSLVIA